MPNSRIKTVFFAAVAYCALHTTAFAWWIWPWGPVHDQAKITTQASETAKDSTELAAKKTEETENAMLLMSSSTVSDSKKDEEKQWGKLTKSNRKIDERKDIAARVKANQELTKRMLAAGANQDTGRFSDAYLAGSLSLEEANELMRQDTVEIAKAVESGQTIDQNAKHWALAEANKAQLINLLRVEQTRIESAKLDIRMQESRRDDIRLRQRLLTTYGRSLD